MRFGFKFVCFKLQGTKCKQQVYNIAWQDHLAYKGTYVAALY
jgi:hypothetical protein